MRHLALLAALALAPAAFGQQPQQSEQSAQQQRRIAMDIEKAAFDGQDRVGAIRYLTLKEDETGKIVFPKLDKARTYWVYSACNGCALSLTAMTARGDSIDDSHDADGEVSLLIPPKSTDELTIEAELHSCDGEKCVIGLGLFVQEQ